jgi:hypothetical protein
MYPGTQIKPLRRSCGRMMRYCGATYSYNCPAMVKYNFYLILNTLHYLGTLLEEMWDKISLFGAHRYMSKIL